MYGLTTFSKKLSLEGSEEDMVALDLKIILAETARNENTMRKRYTDLGGSGGLYSKKFHNERKVSGENGPETDSEASSL